MANESTGTVMGSKPFAGVAPGLVGVHGRLRIEVAGNARSQPWWSRGRRSCSAPTRPGRPTRP